MRTLAEVHDLVMLDLDGVVYIGDRAGPGAAEAVRRLGAVSTPVAYVTNNAARTPSMVAAHLVRLGLPAEEDDVVTAAQAAAGLLVEAHGVGAPIFLAGGHGLAEALSEEGLRFVTDPDESVAAVVTGFGPDLPWSRVVQAAVLISNGTPWVAANADLTFPTALGIGPGHGALVKLLADFSGMTPVVAGKPQTPLLERTIARSSSRHPLMVGDRLDTDIAGAQAVGIPSLLVLTGVTGLADLVEAPPELRPTYLGQDLEALFRPHPLPMIGAAHDGWTVTLVDDRLLVTGDGSTDAWWRAVVQAAWGHLDATGRVADTSGLRLPAATARGSVTP